VFLVFVNVNATFGLSKCYLTKSLYSLANLGIITAEANVSQFSNIHWKKLGFLVYSGFHMWLKLNLRILDQIEANVIKTPGQQRGTQITEKLHRQ